MYMVTRSGQLPTQLGMSIGGEDNFAQAIVDEMNTQPSGALAVAMYDRIVGAGLSPDVDTWSLISDKRLEYLLGPMTWLVYTTNREALNRRMRELASSTDNPLYSPTPP